MTIELDDFEDILEPRRSEISHWFYALRPSKPLLPCERNRSFGPEEIKRETLKSTKITNLIEKAIREEIPPSIIVKKVTDILDEIGYGRKVWVIRILAYVLTKITTRICGGIYVNRKSVQNLKSHMGDVPIVYVPSHRSYADFILMSYVLFYYDIDIPAIAAGMDFHGMKGMGTVLRNTGAYFMRRSYTSDSLYWDTFREYVQQLVIKGDKGIEFFVEGTRSRTGKSLYPKFGLLTMILKAFFSCQVPDILFVPISLTYDRIMEERLFAFELLGVPKPKESTKGFFKSLSIIRENMGNIYVNFGEPISTREFFKDRIDRSIHNLTPRHLHTPTDKERAATSLLAHNLISNQQKLHLITTFNLLATVFSMHRNGVDFDRVFSQVNTLRFLLIEMGASTDFDGSKDKLLETLNVHRNLIRIDERNRLGLIQDGINLGNVDKSRLKGYELSEKTMTKAVPLVMMQIYINPVLHYFVNPTLILLVLFRNKTGLNFDKLIEEFNFLRSVFAREFVLFPENSELKFKNSLNALRKLNVITIEDVTVFLNDKKPYWDFFKLLELFFHSYYVVCCVLINNHNRQEKESKILSMTQCLIENLLQNPSNDFLHPYSLSLDVISNCLQSLIDLKILEGIKKQDGLYFQAKADLINNFRNRIGDYILEMPHGISYKFKCKL